jgi:hypothetical protein
MWILAGLRRVLALAAFYAAVTCSATAQDSNELQTRLALFQNAQTTCKARVLMDQKLATDFVTARKSSLTQVCECAALITVANVSSETSELPGCWRQDSRESNGK